MYEAEPDPYCYPGTSVLINKLDLKDQAELDAFEAEITAQRAAEPLPAGDLDYRQYCAIHRHGRRRDRSGLRCAPSGYALRRADEWMSV